MQCYNSYMVYHLTRRAVLKWLETPSIYHISKDELYELDGESFRFLEKCASDEGCWSKDGAFIDYCMEEGLVTREKVAAPHPCLEPSPRPSLRYLELQITSSCNLKCRHCYLGDHEDKELSPAVVKNVLKEFERMQGLRVLITGGEPLLHSRFNEINEMLPDFFMRKVLFTNGLLLKKDLVGLLKVDEIQVSVDGLEEAHDRLRGAGTFSKAMASIKLAIDGGFDVSISTMVHRGNLADFDAMEQLFKDMGIKDWTVDVPCSAGRLEKNNDLLIGPEEGGRYLGYGFGGGLHASGQGYGCGLHLMAVMADGSIGKCSFYRDKPIGSVEDGLRTVWSRLQPVRLSDLQCKCDYLEICRGGCRYRAELLEGKGGRDRYRCMLYGML